MDSFPPLLKICGLLFLLILPHEVCLAFHSERINGIIDVELQLPKPFVVSTSIGVNAPKDKQGSNVEEFKLSAQDSEKILIDSNGRITNDNVYDFRNEKLKSFVTSRPLADRSPTIKFYQMNCSIGRKCSAIIPAHTTTPRTRGSHRTDEEIRDYLKKHGLENGFNYFNDESINKNNVIARYFKGEQENKESARSARRISSMFNNNDYWPGSQYRPNPIESRQKIKTKAKIYKYGNQPNFGGEPSSSSDFGSSWSHIQTVPENAHHDFYIPEDLPSPSQWNQKPYHPQQEKPNIYEQDPKGIWNRYSNSVVSQYDRKQNDWVEISSSNLNLGSGYVNENIKSGNGYPPKIVYSSQQKPSAGIAVLGISDEVNSYPFNRTKRPSITPSSYENPFKDTYGRRPFPSPSPSPKSSIWRRGIVYRL